MRGPFWDGEASRRCSREDGGAARVSGVGSLATRLSHRSGSGGFRRNPRQLSALEQEAFAAPGDGVAGEAPDPEEEGDEVARQQEQEIAEHLRVAKDADADHERETHANHQGEDEEGDAFETEAGGDEVQK